MENRIKEVKKITNNPFLNYYEMTVVNKNGKEHPYYMATRMKDDRLKCLTGQNPADGVLICGIHQGDDGVDRIVLVRQLRYPVNAYVYELPAGLVDEGETPAMAAVREYLEETGLHFIPLNLDPALMNPYYSSVGMTDESVATAYGYASGRIASDGLEENEDLTVVLADRKEAVRILKEEQVCSKCAYLLLHFINSENGCPFRFLEPFLL
ncbi:MAG: NUDIX hydrolase [Lachnospiraceae bacterium]|nr:NUDIX hydrolase [Lachnospiraceae bacterium]